MSLGVGGSSYPGGTPPSPLVRTAQVSHPYFRRSVTNLLNARAEFGAVAWSPPCTTAATKRGARFEEKVVASLSAAYGTQFLAGLPFSFQTCSKRGRAIPDGLLFSSDWKSVVVVEIKLRHSGDAWWQLERFYLPIVRESLRPLNVTTLEVCRYYDPAVRLPRPVAFVNEALEALSIRECFHPVMIHDGKR